MYAFGGFISAVEVKTLHTWTSPIVSLATKEEDALFYANKMCYKKFPVGEYANHSYKIVGRMDTPVKFDE